MHTVPARFRDRITITDTGCWAWTGSLDSSGYAQVKDGDRSRLVHRLMWELLVGPIPDGHDLDHVKARGCVLRHCVNPDHLEPTTHRENVLRSSGPAALAAQATHCPQNHPYEGRNLLVFADGKRRCRICRNERDKRWKKAKRARA